MSKIEIIGASGFLGTKLYSMLGEDHEISGTYNINRRENLHKLDITDREAVISFIKKQNPKVVIHTAALSDADKCETDREEAERINHIGTRNIVEACRETDSKLVYISTVYVFDGERGNYTELDDLKSVNFYGETKIRAEKEVETLQNSVIIRFDILYGFNGHDRNNGFFSKVIKGNGVQVNKDQKRQPLLVDDVGTFIGKVLPYDQRGAFHLAGPHTLTKYELGLRLERVVREGYELIPIPEKQQVARRPLNVSIDTLKARSLGMAFHDIEDGIKLIEGQYFS